MKKLSFTEENYLKSIFFLSKKTGGLVNTNALAQRLDSKAATVTDMLRRLADKKLISYTPYKGATLSEQGKKVAISILRKHRLWETFLVQKLDFGWEEVHEIAEQLEHINSSALTEKLAAFLGYPDYDPHGDPIPNAQGVFPKRADFTLNNAQEGKRFAIKGVKDNSAEFLKYIRSTGIGLGDEVEVLRVESFDKSLHLKHGDKSITLSALAASNIYAIEL